MRSRTRKYMGLSIAIVIGSAGGNMAYAGAWPQPIDHLQIIVPYTLTRATEEYDAHGKPVRRNRYIKNEWAPYFEYGLTGHTTLVGQLTLISDHTSWLGKPVASRSLSEIKIGARFALGEWQKTYFSLQPQLIRHGSPNQSDPFASRRGDIDGEFAVTLGRHFKWFGLDGFSDNLVGLDVRPANRPSALKVDLTLGVDFNPRTKLMLKSESYTSFSKGNAASQVQSSKLGLSLVRRLDKTVSFEVGAMASLSGRNTIKERSIRFALWYDF